MGSGGMGRENGPPNIEQKSALLHELNNKCYSIGIFLDISKACDTIHHNNLLEKLQGYGFRGIVKIG